MESLGDGRANHALENGLPASRIGPRDPALLVSRGAQRDVGRPLQHQMIGLRTIAAGINVVHIGAHLLVYRDGAFDPQRDPGILPQQRLSSDPGPNQDQVCIICSLLRDHPPRSAFPVGLYALGRLAH